MNRSRLSTGLFTAHVLCWGACGTPPDDVGLAPLGSEEARRHCDRDGLMFWTEANLVRAARLDGSGVMTVATGSFPTSVAVDAARRKVYWADNGTDTVTVADLDGAAARQIYASADPFANPRGMAVDSARRRLYWTEGSKVRSAALYGAGAATIATGDWPIGAAVDPRTGQVYWTDNGTDTVQRMNGDGMALEQLVISPDRFANPAGVALDGRRRQLFWTEGQTVRTASLDGTGAVTIATGSYPTDVALDTGARQVYWTDNGTDSIQRMSEDGTGLQRLYTSPNPFSNPRGMALYLPEECRLD